METPRLRCIHESINVSRRLLYVTPVRESFSFPSTLWNGLTCGLTPRISHDWLNLNHKSLWTQHFVLVFFVISAPRFCPTDAPLHKIFPAVIIFPDINRSLPLRMLKTDLNMFFHLSPHVPTSFEFKALDASDPQPGVLAPQGVLLLYAKRWSATNMSIYIYVSTYWISCHTWTLHSLQQAEESRWELTGKWLKKLHINRSSSSAYWVFLLCNLQKTCLKVQFGEKVDFWASFPVDALGWRPAQSFWRV